MGNSTPKPAPNTPIESKDLVGMYSASTGKDHVLYIDLRADGTVKWRHDGREAGKEASGDCSGKWEYRVQPVGEVVFNLSHDEKAAFHKNIPAATLLARASFEAVQLAATKAATSSAKRVSIVSSGTGSNAVGKGAVLRATFKRIKEWPADFGNSTLETSPERCVGCSTTFKY